MTSRGGGAAGTQPPAAVGRVDPAWDIVVVGGGPVGMAAAVHGARRGLRVAVVEPREPPIDKACGEGLMPTALHELALIDVEPPGWDFVGIRYVEASSDVEVAAEFTGASGRGVRRTALHRAICERAQCCGVSVLRERAVDVGWDESRAAVSTASGRRLAARYVIGADGLHSLVRRRVGLERPVPTGVRRFGIRRHFAVEPWDDHVQVHWARQAEAYVTPVGDRCVGVAVLTSQRADFEQLLDGFPALRRRLARVQRLDRVQGAGPLRQPVAAPGRGRVLLVGDAAGYVDALTGEGLAVGFSSARLAVDAISTGDVGGYPARWRRMTLRSRVLTEATLLAANTPGLRRRIVTEAARSPAVFAAAVRALA